MMKGFGQEVPVKPTDQKPETRVLRARLILEECLETIWDGLRVNVSLVWKGTAPDTGKPTGCRHHVRFEALEFESYGEGADLVELADGCADISVVTIGTLSAFGIKDKPLLEEVDANNQAKIDTGKTDEHGKFVKHPDHRPPDIGGVLNQQGWTNARTAAF
jgi:predicted HAD superfamily Cof-like phosphohydrolase